MLKYEYTFAKSKNQRDFFKESYASSKYFISAW